jgi:pentatricopeptide repeat protein
MLACVAVSISLLHKCYNNKRIHSVLCHSAYLKGQQRSCTLTRIHTVTHAHCLLIQHTHNHTHQFTYNSAIACCAHLRLWRRGVSLLDEMRRRRVTPDQYSYNSAIAACVKARQTQQMAAVLARMREAGYSPDLVTYSNLIQVLTCLTFVCNTQGFSDIAIRCCVIV